VDSKRSAYRGIPVQDRKKVSVKHTVRNPCPLTKISSVIIEAVTTENNIPDYTLFYIGHCIHIMKMLTSFFFNLHSGTYMKI
jgi:hypothetical protein